MSMGTRHGGGVTGTGPSSLPGEEMVPSEGTHTVGAPWVRSGGGFSGDSFDDLLAEERRSALSAKQSSAHDPEDPYAGMSRRERRKAKKEAEQLGGTFDDHAHLLALKPREKYVFRSDYYEIDGTYACIMGFFHDDEARDDFGAFWGISRIPAGLDDGVSTVLFEQVRRMGEKWVSDRIKMSEKLDRLEEGEQAQTGTMTSKRKAAKVSDDVEVASGEIQDGASYLHVHNRILVKAPSLEALDDSVDRITRLYIDRFATLKVAAYPGEQRPELTNVLGKNDVKRGKGFHYTSLEFAGSHSLVTNGLNDATGEYVGYMVGDVNNSAVLFDVNDYQGHVVVADSSLRDELGRAHVPDLWGSKISQAAMVANGRVVHIVLDGADLDRLGPKFNRLTKRLDMNTGDINMFEMFGAEEDEMSIFPAHLEKLVLMADQAHQMTDNRSIITGSLKDTLTEFYIDKGMWAHNAKNHRDRLRVVNIPHTHVPRLQDIVTYFDTRYKSLVNTKSDQDAVRAYNVLRLVFRDLLDGNGDLFNVHTKDEIDGVGDARRVIYDFSKLSRRGKGIAMAQLVNVIGFAVENLGLGDTVVIHGTEQIDDRVKEYITTQFEHLRSRGGRVAYLYNDVDKMLADSEFNRFDAADWTILGTMRDATVAEYQKQLHQKIPPDLEKLVTRKGSNLAYLRRGYTNVVFWVDLALGIAPARRARRAQLGVDDDAEPIDALAAPPRRVESEALMAAQGERAEEREERVGHEGAQARLGMKRSRTPRRTLVGSGASPSTDSPPNPGPSRGRMTRNR